MATQEPRIIYVCPTCLTISEQPLPDHPHQMSRCNAGIPGDEKSKPIMTPDGGIVTHAPRWWVESCLALERQEQSQGAE